MSLSSKTVWDLAPHLVVFFICLAILTGAAVLSSPESGSTDVRLGRFPIPQTCTFKNLCGLPCPGCGLTRSLVAGIHGEFRRSFEHHRLGLLTLGYILVQLFFRAGVIFVPSLRKGLLRLERRLNQGIIVLAALFAANWIVTLILL